MQGNTSHQHTQDLKKESPLNHFLNTKNKKTDNNTNAFKLKPWTPPPEALTKTQYRIYVRSTQPKIYRAIKVKKALTAVRGYSREANLLEDLYPQLTSFSDPKGYFGKIIKLLGNNKFLCIAHFRTIFGQYV